jgi:ethanolamine utilization protein EutM
LLKLALGLIETVGMVAAIEAADAAVKSANVSLIGYELTKGGGMVTVKLQGDVGAVNAAVQAGSAAASKIGKVYSVKVIARPHQELSSIIFSKETKGYAVESVPLDIIEEALEDAIEEMVAEAIEEAVLEAIIETVAETIAEAEKKAEAAEATCNLCNDPECPRKKGELRELCINRG